MQKQLPVNSDLPFNVLNLTNRLFLILTLMVLGACQQHQPLVVAQEQVEGVDLRQYRTFSVTPVHHSDAQFVKHINFVIETHLQEKGYILSSQPELQIEYRVDIEGKEKVLLDPIPTPDGSIYIQNTMESVNTAKILVNAIDQKTGAAVWKASSKDLIKVNTKHINQMRLNRHMGELFESFPRR